MCEKSKPGILSQEDFETTLSFLREMGFDYLDDPEEIRRRFKNHEKDWVFYYSNSLF